MKSGGYMAWFSVYKGNIQIAQRQWNLDAKIVTRRDSGRDLSVCPTKTLLAIGISWKPYQYMIFGGAKSHRVIGLFFFKETYNTVGFGRSPRAVSPKRTMDLRPTEIWRDLAKVSDDATSRSDPTSHARIPRMTVVATQLPQISSIKNINNMNYWSY